jgi:hypothetical protein
MGREIDDLARTLPAEAVAAARQRGQSLDFQETLGVLLEEFKVYLTGEEGDNKASHPFN